MVVTITAHGALRERVGATTRVDNVQTVGEALSRLPLPEVEGLAILVNGHLAHWHTHLNDGDAIQIIPQLAGGVFEQHTTQPAH